MGRSRVRGEYQWRVVGDDRAVLQVPLVRVHVIRAPLEPAAGERAQISGQPPFARHEVQTHFELLFELFLQIRANNDRFFFLARIPDGDRHKSRGVKAVVPNIGMRPKT